VDRQNTGRQKVTGRNKRKRSCKRQGRMEVVGCFGIGSEKNDRLF